VVKVNKFKNYTKVFTMGGFSLFPLH